MNDSNCNGFSVDREKFFHRFTTRNIYKNKKITKPVSGIGVFPVASSNFGFVFSKRHNGFSLCELLVSLTIIGILISFALPVYSSYTAGVRDSAATANVNKIAMALEQYYGEHFSYRADTEILNIPDSDQWFDYTISNQDRYSYQIFATPRDGNSQQNAFQLDHFGRQFYRSTSSAKWNTGWP